MILLVAVALPFAVACKAPWFFFEKRGRHDQAFLLPFEVAKDHTVEATARDVPQLIGRILHHWKPSTRRLRNAKRFY